MFFFVAFTAYAGNRDISEHSYLHELIMNTPDFLDIVTSRISSESVSIWKAEGRDNDYINSALSDIQTLTANRLKMSIKEMIEKTRFADEVFAAAFASLNKGKPKTTLNDALVEGLQACLSSSNASSSSSSSSSSAAGGMAIGYDDFAAIGPNLGAFSSEASNSAGITRSNDEPASSLPRQQVNSFVGMVGKCSVNAARSHSSAASVSSDEPPAKQARRYACDSINLRSSTLPDESFVADILADLGTPQGFQCSSTPKALQPNIIQQLELSGDLSDHGKHDSIAYMREYSKRRDDWRLEVMGKLMEKLQSLSICSTLQHSVSIPWTHVDPIGWPENVLFFDYYCWGIEDIRTLEKSMSDISFVLRESPDHAISRQRGKQLKNELLHELVIYLGQEYKAIPWRIVKDHFMNLHLTSSRTMYLQTRDEKYLSEIIDHFRALNEIPKHKASYSSQEGNVNEVASPVTNFSPFIKIRHKPKKGTG